MGEQFAGGERPASVLKIGFFKHAFDFNSLICLRLLRRNRSRGCCSQPSSLYYLAAM